MSPSEIKQSCIKRKTGPRRVLLELSIYDLKFSFILWAIQLDYLQCMQILHARTCRGLIYVICLSI